MQRYSVFLSATAEQDVHAIFDYISHTLKAPETAHKHLAYFDKTLSSLETNPTIHPLVRDERLAVLGYRWVAIRRYVAFYTVSEIDKSVNVVRVLHSRMNWAGLL